MRQVSIIGQQFPVPEDTDAADMPKWATLYTDALKAAFAATPSSAFPVPTAANNDQVLITVGGLPKWTVSPYVKKSGDTMTGPLNITEVKGQAAGLILGYSGNQVEIRNGTGAAASGTVAHANAAYANQSATLGQIPSSRAVKQDIRPLTARAFANINPVSFRYTPDAPCSDVEREGTHAGFLAEDVEAAGVRIMKDPDGNVIGLHPLELIAVLWAKVQELETRITALEAKS